MKDEATCQARAYKRHCPPCGEPADTVRRVQAAPGLWVHVDLCHFHQHHWDEGEEWGGPMVDTEIPCLERKKSSCRKRGINHG